MGTKVITPKASISFKSHNWDKIKDARNRSAIVNKALELYFERNDFLDKAEKLFWDKKIQDGLDDIKNGDYTEIEFDGSNMEEILEGLWN